jgi:RNA polymerase sigma-70 factor (ECF subfamily)
MAGTPVARQDLPDLCRQLRPRLRRILADFHIPPQDAEDLVQTTLLLALRKWSLIRDPHSWLFGALRNRCLFYWRERRRHGERHDSLADHAPGPAIFSAQTRRDLLADLATLSLRLPRLQRAVLALHCQGLGPLEVAEATGLARSSVRKTRHRAVAELRRAAAMRPPAADRRGPR